MRNSIERMKEVGLNDFLMLLKLGIWTGAYVEKIGYISSAQRIDSPAKPLGLLGIGLAHNVMLERCEASGNAHGYELTISVYNPCNGEHTAHKLFTKISDKAAFLKQLKSITDGTLGRIAYTKKTSASSQLRTRLDKRCEINTR